MTITLAQHLSNLNAEKLAWVAEDPDNRWTGLYVEELDFWAEMGITTVQQFKRHEDETCFWEMYKDVHGFRPRHVDIKSMSDEELHKELDYLGEQIARQVEQDEVWEAEMISHAQEDAEEENKAFDEAPLPIDYVACHFQEGWL